MSSEVVDLSGVGIFPPKTQSPAMDASKFLYTTLCNSTSYFKSLRELIPGSSLMCQQYYFFLSFFKKSFAFCL